MFWIKETTYKPYNCYEEEVEEEGEEEKIKEKEKVSFVQAVTALDNLVLFSQQQDLSVDIQVYN